MGQQITAGQANALAHITKAALDNGLSNKFTVPESVNFFVLEALPTVGALEISLPGPASAATAPARPGEAPNDGDEYTYEDPLQLALGANVIIDGGGFPFLLEGIFSDTVEPAPTFGQGTGAVFVFNSTIPNNKGGFGAWMISPEAHVGGN